MKASRALILGLAVCVLPSMPGVGAVRVSYSYYLSNFSTSPSLTVSGDSNVSVKPGDGTSWQMSFADTDAVAGRIIVKGTPNLDGYSSYEQSFDVPFVWPEKAPFDLAASFSSDKGDDNGARQVTGAAGGIKDASIKQLVELQQRAGRVFQSRLHDLQSGEHHSPDTYDVAVAYDYLLATRELVTKKFAVLNNEQDTAIEWLSARANDRADLFSNGLTVAAARSVIKDLQNRGSFFYEWLANDLDKRMRLGKASMRAQLCGQIRKFENFIENQADSDESGQIDLRFHVSLTVASYDAQCLAAAFQDDRAHNVALPTEDLERAKDLLSRLDDLTRGQGRPDWASAYQNARNRRTELNNLMGT